MIKALPLGRALSFFIYFSSLPAQAGIRSHGRQKQVLSYLMTVMLVPTFNSLAAVATTRPLTSL